MTTVNKPQILLLTSPKHGGLPHNHLYEDMMAFVESVNKTAEFTIYLSAVDCLEFSIVNGKATIYDIHNRRDLSTYDLIHTRNVVNGIDFFKAVGVYAQHHGIRVLEPQDVGRPYFGKLSQMYLFAMNGVPVPDTWACWFTEQFIDLLRANISFPFILKANGGMKGNDNYLVNDLEEAKRILDDDFSKQFVAQDFIPNDGSYRVLYMGLNHEPEVFMRQNVPGSHLGNVSQGAKIIEMKFSDLAPSEQRIAEKVANLIGRQNNGIDLLQNNETKEWYVLEANTAPALSTGGLRERKVERYVDFMNEYIKRKS